MDNTEKDIYNKSVSDQDFDEPGLVREDIKTIENVKSFTVPPDLAEDYIKLSDNILTLNLRKRIQTIAISNSTHGEGASTVAFNLAVTLAGKRESDILIVDGNLRNPSLHNSFGSGKENGLSELMYGEIDLNGALKKSAVPNLFFMTSGKMRTETNQIFTTERFRQFINMIGNHFEYVLIDSPPINEYPDSAILSTLVDGTLLVIQSEKVIYEIIGKAKEKIESSGGTILGVVLNRRRYHIPYMIYRKL